MTVLLLPRPAAIDSDDDRAERAHRPAEQWILRRERNCEKMIVNATRSQHPLAATVRGRENNAARAGDHHARAVFDVEPVESCIRWARLFFPVKTAVVGREYDAVRADGPTALLVWGKFDPVDRVSLWEWVLPLPAAKRILSVYDEGKDQEIDREPDAGSRQSTL